MLSDKRILVVEREFLVALDMQRVLEGANPAKLVFARSVDEAAHLASSFSGYDRTNCLPPRWLWSLLRLTLPSAGRRVPWGYPS